MAIDWHGDRARQLSPSGKSHGSHVLFARVSPRSRLMRRDRSPLTVRYPMRLLRSVLPALAAICVCTGVASAFHLNGVVTCSQNGTPVAGVTVIATSTDPADRKSTRLNSSHP